MGQSSSLFSYILADYQPLYHVICYLFTHLLGYSEFVLRLPSLISGIFTVYFVIKIAEPSETKLGIIAGPLSATNLLSTIHRDAPRRHLLRHRQFLLFY